MKKKLLLYGGAFDPPHKGHERLLRAAIEAVRPDLTLVTPSEVSPHKDAAPVPFADRAAMCRVFLGCGGNVKISEMENSGARRKSYTFHTVRRLQKKYPDAEIYLLIGGDMLRTFDEWRRYRRLLSAVVLVAAARDDGERQTLQQAGRRAEQLGGRVILLDTEPVNVSSTEIRARLKKGLDVREMLGEHVAEYAEKRGLYR